MEIRKKVIGDNTPYMRGGPSYTLYVLVEDGRRIDSFLYRKNAVAKAIRLVEMEEEALQSRTPCATLVERKA